MGACRLHLPLAVEPNGAAAWVQSRAGAVRIDLETGEGQTATDMQLAQNKAMFARIKYQGLAIAVVAILLAVSR